MTEPFWTMEEETALTLLALWKRKKERSKWGRRRGKKEKKDKINT